MSDGIHKIWVHDPAGTGLLTELSAFYLRSASADLRNHGTIDVRVTLAASSPIASMLVKNALLRLTRRATADGKTSSDSSTFFFQDYVIREPVYPKSEGANLVFDLRGFADGFDLKDTILLGPYESGTPLQTATAVGAVTLTPVSQRFVGGEEVTIGGAGTSSNPETRTIISTTSTTITVAPALDFAHGAGERVMLSNAGQIARRFIQDGANNITAGTASPDAGSTTIPASGANAGVIDTTGDGGGLAIQYRYENDRLMDKLKDLGRAVGCIVQVRRLATNPLARVIDFLNPDSAIAPRPDGTFGFKTNDPITAGDTTRILDIFGGATTLSATNYQQYDEAEAATGTSVATSAGTGSTQAVGQATASGPGGIYTDSGLLPTDTNSATLVAQAQQEVDPDPRVSVDVFTTGLWRGQFTAILGDTIAIRDQSSGKRILGTDFVGQFVRWEYSQGTGKYRIFLNRTRYYDDELTKQSRRNYEQSNRNNQGAQNVTSPVFSQDASSTIPVNVKFYIPDNVDEVQQFKVNLRAAPVRQNSRVILSPVSVNLNAVDNAGNVYPGGPTQWSTGPIPSSPSGFISLTGTASVAGVNQLAVTVSVRADSALGVATSMPSSGFYTGHNATVDVDYQLDGGTFTEAVRENVAFWNGTWRRTFFISLSGTNASSVGVRMVVFNREGSSVFYTIGMSAGVYTTTGAVTSAGASSATVAIAIDGVPVTGAGSVAVNDTASITIPLGTAAGQFSRLSRGFHTMTITPTSSTPVNLTGQLDIHLAYRMN